MQASLLDTQVASLLLILGDAASATADVKPQDNGILQPLVTGLETTLKFLQNGLDGLKVPYSYGWSIVLLTVLVKAVTFPLTKKQIESSMAMQKLKPELGKPTQVQVRSQGPSSQPMSCRFADALKSRYGEDKDTIQKETALLYEQAGVDPLAGCLPSLATIPIFIGLYRSLSSVASEGALDEQGFYWIPTLAGPTTVAAQKAGAGTAWLFPFVDGHPPIGWDQAEAYLVLPVLLVLLQYVSITFITPPTVDENNESSKTTANILKLLPLMIGWFSLNTPAGLSLYYFSNTTITMATTVSTPGSCTRVGATSSHPSIRPTDLPQEARWC